jgi:hypothetical protein
LDIETYGTKHKYSYAAFAASCFLR